MTFSGGGIKLAPPPPPPPPPPGEGIVFDGVGGRVLNGMYTVHEAGFVNYKIALSDLS